MDVDSKKKKEEIHSISILELKIIKLEDKLLHEKQRYELLQSELESSKLYAIKEVDIYKRKCMGLEKTLSVLERDYYILKEKEMKNEEKIKHLLKRIKITEKDYRETICAELKKKPSEVELERLKKTDHELEKNCGLQKKEKNAFKNANETKENQACEIVDIGSESDDENKLSSEFNKPLVKVKNEPESQMKHFSDSIPSCKFGSTELKESFIEITEMQNTSVTPKDAQELSNELDNNYGLEEKEKDAIENAEETKENCLCETIDIATDSDDDEQLSTKFNKPSVKVKNEPGSQMNDFFDSIPSCEFGSTERKESSIEEEVLQITADIQNDAQEKSYTSLTTRKRFRSPDSRCSSTTTTPCNGSVSYKGIHAYSTGHIQSASNMQYQNTGRAYTGRIPSSKQEIYAVKSAEEFQKNIQNPSCIRLLRRSHVSSSYWLGLKKEFCMDNLPDHEMKVILEGTNGLEYEVNYIGRRNALVGGWPIFAKAHHLEIGDVLIFELTEPARFKVYIMKAILDAQVVS